MFKSVEDLQQMSRSQIEATTQSAAALSRGLQQIATEVSELSKKGLEESSTLFSRLISVKSFQGAVEIQSDYAKSSYEGMVAAAARMGELVASVAKDSYQPFEQVRGFAK